MQIINYPLGQLQTNGYFLIDGKKCLIIDPADSAEFILEKIQRENLELVGLLATHGHFDHILVVGEIQLSYKIPLLISQDDMFLVRRLNKTAEYFLGYDPHAVDVQSFEYLNNRTTTIGPFVFEVIKTPGHTPGSCCFYFPKDKMIFTGDTLFKQGIGRYDFSYSDKKLLDESLQKLFKLPEDTIVYPGHGEETTIGEEKGGFSLRSK